MVQIEEIRTDGTDMKIKVLSDIDNMKSEVKDVKEAMSKMQVSFAEMKVEIKQIVGSSATKTSSAISILVNVIGGVIMFLLVGKS